jgi:hypothetical protein
METIDVTPTWSGILPALLLVLENGDPAGKKVAREELQNMARIADLFVTAQKNAANNR